MTARATSAAGTPFWVAQLSPDPEEATAFYGEVLGWRFTDVAGAGGPPFWIASLDGVRVASLTGPQDPATWIVAVAVPDVDEARTLAEDAGGTAPGASVDIATLGRFHRLHDPSGAEVHVARPLDDGTPTRLDEPGAWCGATLLTADVSAVRDFYGAVFGWRAEPSGAGSTRFRASGGPDDVVLVAEGGASGRGRWTPAFAVSDVDAAVESAVLRGATVVGPARGRSTVLRDPGGARFTVQERLPASRPPDR